MTTDGQLMVEALTPIAERHGWAIELNDDKGYYATVILHRQDLAIAVTYELREGQFVCTLYWLPGPYQGRDEQHFASWNLYSFGLHEFIRKRADRRFKRAETKRLWRSARPSDQERFKAQIQAVAALIETYAADVLAGDHTAIQSLGRAGPEGKLRGYSSPERDAEDARRARRDERLLGLAAAGCVAVLALIVGGLITLVRKLR